MSQRPTLLSARQLAEAARAGRENALQERDLAELSREESTDVNGGAILDPFGTGGTTTGYALA